MIVPLEMVNTDRQILEHLEPSLREASPDAAVATIALVAAEEVGFDAGARDAALRRALLVLASGGDLRRDLALDDRAVTTLAEDLEDPARRGELEAALQRLRAHTDELPAAASAVEALLHDPDRAWKALAAAVLADELTE